MKSIFYGISLNKGSILSLLFIVLMVILAAISVHAERLTVKGEKVNLRAGPGKNYSVKWAYGSGFPVERVERKGDWLKVKDFEDDTGWIHKS